MGWLVNAAPWPLYPPERPGSHCTGGSVGPRVGLDGCGKSQPPTGIRSLDRPVRSESLYRLSYAGPCCCYTLLFRSGRGGGRLGLLLTFVLFPLDILAQG